ncbi:MAG TPA: XRE family transcriptional regulator [Roseomonas sp.]|nr:XRE family transcriptional regulator [Roseomonas sp.]
MPVVLGQPEVGRKLADGRRAKQWTLARLSEESGVAVGTLSKVENGKSGASFDTVARVARALGLRIDDLLSPASPRFAMGRRIISKRGEGVRFGFNSYDYIVPCNELTRKAMVPLIMTIRTREVLPPESWASHEGEEYIYVLSGSIELHTEFYEPTRLDAGDSAYIDSTMRHAFASVGDEDARILSVCLADSLPRLFADAPVDLAPLP